MSGINKFYILYVFTIDSLRLFLRKSKMALWLLPIPKTCQDGDYGNAYIRQMLEENICVFVGRVGFIESVYAGAVLSMRTIGIGRKLLEKTAYKIFEHDQFWPPQFAQVSKYGEETLAAISQIDVYIGWKTFLERIFRKYVCSKSSVCVDFYSLEPFCYEKPWSSGLKGKRVLVICPFPKTIERQYQKRKLLWPSHPEILPDFELLTMKSIYGKNSAPQCLTWFDALDCMYNEAMKHVFDVAILACGPFAIPLGQRFKSAGRSAITMCGVTQILFGIKGKRWDDRPYISKFYNEHWVRPDENELPEFTKRIEGGCYR